MASYGKPAEVDSQGVEYDSDGSSDSSDEQTPCCECGSIVPACGNFAIQYNYACASIAIAVMLSDNGHTGRSVHPDYPEPRWAKQYLLSIVFIGSVAGMLTMGYLGDLLGIKRALVVSNSLTVLGSVASAFLSLGDSQHVWGVITLSRFVLGVGVGGNYPLSAAKASHACGLHEAVQKAGRAFFWQGPGGIAPYLLGLVLMYVFPVVQPLHFRILLGVGAIPAMVVLFATIQEEDMPTRAKKDGQLAAALRSPEHWRTLVGTAGTWFLFDVAFYGTVIFTPTILKGVFGSKQSLTDICVRASMMCLLGMLGTALGLLVFLPRFGPKALNTWGLAVAAAFFAAFAGVYRQHHDASLLLFTFLCVLFFALYLGPNVATFLLPVVAFPEEVRSTFHGLSAAAAKIGAMFGALLFPIIDDLYGVPTVMAVQAAVCALPTPTVRKIRRHQAARETLLFFGNHLRQ